MIDRRQKRKMKRKKKQINIEEIPCIVFLSSKENKSFDLAEQKENKQFNMIAEYAKAHSLVPMKVIRRSCFSQRIVDEQFQGCINLMKNGKARAILVANMEYISQGLVDIYRKVGLVQEAGFRIYSVDEGELKLDLKKL